MASALPSAPAPWEAPLTSGPIPIKLSLGGADLEFDRGAWTGQRPQASAAVSSPRPTVAVAEMERLQKQLQELEASVAASETEKRQLEFKNRLLTEMLAVSRLDFEKRKEDIATERQRVEALKWRLVHERQEAVRP